MAKNRNRASKADVQSTELNKMPVVDANDTEFASENVAGSAKANRRSNAGKNRG